MVSPALSILAAAAVTGIALSPAAATAATPNPGALAISTTNAPDATTGNTTTTFTVASGVLGMTAPATADLGSGGVNSTISGTLGTVTVTDLRATVATTWAATASSTNWTTGADTLAETIPATDVGYDPGSITTTGTITATGAAITLSGAAQPVVAGTAGVADNTAAWDPTLAVVVPATAVGGLYTATLTQSVS
jgi:hypothetical protein